MGASHFCVWGADRCEEGRQAISRGDFSAAEPALRQCVEQQPAVLDAHLMLAGVYQTQGDAEGVLRVAKLGVQRFPADPRFYLAAGTYAGRLKKYGDAVAVMEVAAKRWPGDAKMGALLASALFGRGSELLDAGDAAGAEANLRRAVKLNPGDTEARLNLARALHNLHRPLEAIAELDGLIADHPKLPLAHFQRGMARQSLGDFDGAVADLTREIEVKGDYPPAYLVRGLALAGKGEWAAALKDFDMAAAGMADDPRVHFGRARCLMQTGQLADAEEALRRAIGLDATDAGPVNALARLLLQTGRGAEAKPWLEKAAELSRKQRRAAPGQIEFAR